MELLSAPLKAAGLGLRAAGAGMRAATLPVRATTVLTVAVYEELLDIAERAALLEPPDPSPHECLEKDEQRLRREAA
jgi:hypothetical protein